MKKALKKHDHFSALSMLTEGLIKAESITFSYIRTEGFFEKSIKKSIEISVTFPCSLKDFAYKKHYGFKFSMLTGGFS